MYFLVANSVIYLVWGNITFNAFIVANKIKGKIVLEMKLKYARWVFRGRKPVLEILKKDLEKCLPKKKIRVKSILKKSDEAEKYKMKPGKKV